MESIATGLQCRDTKTSSKIAKFEGSGRGRSRLSEAFFRFMAKEFFVSAKVEQPLSVRILLRSWGWAGWTYFFFFWTVQKPLILSVLVKRVVFYSKKKKLSKKSDSTFRFRRLSRLINFLRSLVALKCHSWSVFRGKKNPRHSAKCHPRCCLERIFWIVWKQETVA